jgi:hypothetical protein
MQIIEASLSIKVPLDRVKQVSPGCDQLFTGDRVLCWEQASQFCSLSKWENLLKRDFPLP